MFILDQDESPVVHHVVVSDASISSDPDIWLSLCFIHHGVILARHGPCLSFFLLLLNPIVILVLKLDAFDLRRWRAEPESVVLVICYHGGDHLVSLVELLAHASQDVN